MTTNEAEAACLGVAIKILEPKREQVLQLARSHMDSGEIAMFSAAWDRMMSKLRDQFAYKENQIKGKP